MLSKLINTCRTRAAKIVAGTVAAFAIVAVPASAAASSTTGIDYVSDLITPVKSELQLAIVAGLALLVILMAVRAGIRLVRGFAR